MTALASDTGRCRPSHWRVQEYSCGFERPNGGGWSDVRGRVVGPDDGAATLVLGGISADRRLVADEDGPGWWPGVAGADGALDPSRRRLVSMDFLDDAAEPFPTVEDQAAAVLMLADAAGIERFTLVGASYGGTVGLTLATLAPDRVTRLDLLCASAGVHPMTQGLRSIQREILKLAIDAGQGARGVDLAGAIGQRAGGGAPPVNRILLEVAERRIGHLDGGAAFGNQRAGQIEGDGLGAGGR